MALCHKRPKLFLLIELLVRVLCLGMGVASAYERSYPGCLCEAMDHTVTQVEVGILLEHYVAVGDVLDHF